MITAGATPTPKTIDQRRVALTSPQVKTLQTDNAGTLGSALAARLMKLAGRVLTRAILTADVVALTIPRYVEYLHASYGAKNALLAPHGSFEDVAVPAYGVPAGRRKVMAFGKWGTYKTVDMLVEAYQELLQRG